MVVTLYDGTREPIQGKDFLNRIFDGFQNQLFDNFEPAPDYGVQPTFPRQPARQLPVLASETGHVDAGFSPRPFSFRTRRPWTISTRFFGTSHSPKIVSSAMRISP
jgi:hypothetical protein